MFKLRICPIIFQIRPIQISISFSGDFSAFNVDVCVLIQVYFCVTVYPESFLRNTGWCFVKRKPGLTC